MKGDGSIPLRESAKLTFVQLTDAHLFDEGKKQSSEDAFRQAADDRAALRWAIEQVNQQVVAGKQSDFVVYTGDLGLENVEVPADGSCSGVAVQPQVGLPTVTLRSAARYRTPIFSVTDQCRWGLGSQALFLGVMG